MRGKYIIASLAALAVGALALVYMALRASLPQLDGAIREAGLQGAVRIERDDLGIPTVAASNRTDLAFATGFVHGQDRFFQMDLSRRLAAGELSELFGQVALEQDEATRLFRFRQVAREVLQQATPDQQAIIAAYAAGVNAGIAALHGRPWEYWVLGSPPARWLPEDSVLVIEAMWWDLQSNGFRREILRQEINERLGGRVCEAGWKCALSFFYPARTAWDAPADAAVEAAAIDEAVDLPAADVLDIRTSKTPAAASSAATAERMPAERLPEAGSNNWAVAGRMTANGSALIASDMHLNQRVPATWYHIRLRVAGSAAEPELDLTGVTLPGAPVLVAGSNGHVAWGFTNSYGNWLDVAHVSCSANGDPSRTITPEVIHVRHKADVVLAVKSSAYGVLLRSDPDGQSCWFASWLAQDPRATNLNLMNLERLTSVEQALALAPQVGIPHQNVVIGDRAGHIAWSIFGRIPNDTRTGRSLGVTAWSSAEDHPRLLDPPSGRIWTANARVCSDPRQLALIGGNLASLGSEYDLGARAQQIRDDLFALHRAVTPIDMLHIQLDDRAVFLARWRDLLLRLIDTDAIDAHPARAQFRQLLTDWSARASVDSTAYRLIRAYHSHTQGAVWKMMMQGLDIPARDSSMIPDQFEHALWELVTLQPMHLLDRKYASWHDFLLEQLDQTIAALQKNCGALSQCRWGSRNTVAIRHPLSAAIPFIGALVDMPTVELPGDNDMPRVQDGTSGASERFAVSPGHEEQAYFHMPGGQSGHPLSPYYRAGFLQWARGEPLPFLPGPAIHTLTLTPRRD